MENIDEIEDFYKKEIEDTDKNFLDKLKISKDLPSLEKEYKTKLANIKKKYYERIDKYLKEQKLLINNFNKKKSPAITKQEYLNVTKFDFKESKKERRARKFEVFCFNTKFKAHVFFNENIPRVLKILFIRSKLKIKIFNHYIERVKERLWESIKENFISLLRSIKKISFKIYYSIKFFLKLIIKLIKRLLMLFKIKKDKESPAKTQDQEIAERLLKKPKE